MVLPRDLAVEGVEMVVERGPQPLPDFVFCTAISGEIRCLENPLGTCSRFHPKISPALA